MHFSESAMRNLMFTELGYVFVFAVLCLCHRLGALGVMFLVLWGSRYDVHRRLQTKETPVTTRGKSAM
jgi:hypothetical protein